MTIPDEIVEAVARERFGVHAQDVSDVPYFDREARSWLESLTEALSAHGYKITGPTVTEAMVIASAGGVDGDDMGVPIDDEERGAARFMWDAMHEAAPATPWESG